MFAANGAGSPLWGKATGAFSAPWSDYGLSDALVLATLELSREEQLRLSAENAWLASENALLRWQCEAACQWSGSQPPGLWTPALAPPGLNTPQPELPDATSDRGAASTANETAVERTKPCYSTKSQKKPTAKVSDKLSEKEPKIDAEHKVEASHDSEFELKPWLRPPPSEPGTSLMMRHIPNNYTRTMLVDLFESRGFAGTFDFVYLPADFKSQANLGYAFINFVDAEHVEPFWRAFQNFSGWCTRNGNLSAMVKGSCKRCKVEWNVCQGLHSLIERFRNNPVMHEAVPEDHKPVYFIDGVEEPFPAPTKPLKAPRLRKPTSKALKALKA